MWTTLHFILILRFYFILFWSAERSGPIWACHHPSHCWGTKTVSLPEVETRCYLTHSGYETNIRNIPSDTFIFPVAWPPTDQTHDRSCRYVGPTQSRRTQCGERHIWPYQIALAHISPLMLQCEVVKSMRPLCACAAAHVSACLCAKSWHHTVDLCSHVFLCVTCQILLPLSSASPPDCNPGPLALWLHIRGPSISLSQTHTNTHNPYTIRSWPQRPMWDQRQCRGSIAKPRSCSRQRGDTHLCPTWMHSHINAARRKPI